MDAQGVFYQMPFSSDGVPLPPQSVTLFSPSFNKDRFTNTAWTLNGRVGALNLVYAGSYLVRNVEAQQDYTNYARGLYADYYQCRGAEPTNGLPTATCFSPRTTWNETLRNTHQSHELRLARADDWRLRGIAGLFWENLRLFDQLNWLYKTLPPCTPTEPYAFVFSVLSSSVFSVSLWFVYTFFFYFAAIGSSPFAAILRMSCVTFIEQNFGPHIEQNFADLNTSCGNVSSCIARAVSGSSDNSNCRFQSNSNRAFDSSSSRLRAFLRPRAMSAAWAAIL